MNNRWVQVIVPIAVVAFIAIVIVLIPQAPQAPQPPTPTSVPTKAPVTNVNVLGGQVFLANPKVVQHILDNYNIQVKFVASGSFDMDKANLNGFDCVWPGSAVAFDEFTTNKPGFIKKSATIFRTPGTFFTWRDYFDEMKKAGLAYEQNGAFVKMDPIFKAIANDRKWTDLKVNIPGSVKIFGSDPERSGGGLTLYELAATYYAGGVDAGEVVRIEQIEPTIPALLKLWEKSGFQSKESPEAFEAFTLYGRGVPFAWSSESLYLSWYNNLDEKGKKDAASIVGIYPDVTIVTDHVLGCWTPAGENLINIFASDKYLQELGWTDHGMRTKAAGIDAKAGDTNVFWVAQGPRLMSETKRNVTDRIKEAIKTYRTTGSK